MIIYEGLYIKGFERIDKGEDGAVFVRYAEAKQDDREPEIMETPLYYGGKDTANYTITIPKPRARKVTACAIVTRSSKNHYQAAVYDEKRIEYFCKTSLEGLRLAVTDFFKKQTKAG